MKVVLFVLALIVGAILPCGVKSQTKARKNRIETMAKQIGISIYTD